MAGPSRRFVIYLTTIESIPLVDSFADAIVAQQDIDWLPQSLQAWTNSTSFDAHFLANWSLHLGH
jgi:hypothetical protein